MFTLILKDGKQIRSDNPAQVANWFEKRMTERCLTGRKEKRKKAA